MDAKGMTVRDLAASLSGNPEIGGIMDSQAEKTRLVMMLVELRNRAGLKQKDLAQKMGVTASKLSRMETSADADLKFGDIDAYVKALNARLSIMLDTDDRPCASQIKQYVLETRHLLEKLRQIAMDNGDDKGIVNGIDAFFRETLFNFMVGFVDNYAKLPASRNSSAKRSSSSTVEGLQNRSVGQLP